MYRLVLYYLISIFLAAIVLSFFDLLPYGPAELAASAAFIILCSWLANTVFARVWRVPPNVESVYITALILALIIAPMRTLADLPFLFWASLLAIASKYIIAIQKKHIFNPAALAVAVTAITLNRTANWWVDALPLWPVVVIGGLLMVRKVRRFKMVFSFLGAALVTIIVFTILKGGDGLAVIPQAMLHTPLLFFAFVMLTEPFTTPPTQGWRIWYGVLVGFLFSPQIHLGQFYTTPELALLAGNIFSYAVSPKGKFILKLKEKILIAPDAYDFVFDADRPLSFRAGQYLEWTRGHGRPDDRGNRRYFTVCSSPTEPNVRIGVKFYDHSSSFKKSLLTMEAGDEIIAGQLAGDFVLPKDKNKKLVFIAGGIGVTPFRSMIKYLLDSRERRTITLIYSNRKVEDIFYQDIFNQAEEDLGIKIVQTITDPLPAGSTWPGHTGFINEQLIKEEVPDYNERIFYISGPQIMVAAMRNILLKMGIQKNNIKTDFFPGLV